MAVTAHSQELEAIAEQLFRVFVGNPKAYAEQLQDGNYKTVYKPLHKERILRMLKDGGSLLTYQMAHHRLRWVCFDLDIKKDVLSRDDFRLLEQAAQAEIFSTARKIVAILENRRIQYLFEFSGNRGVHIWILWEGWVQRNFGFSVQQRVLDESDALAGLSYTTIDRFPASPSSIARLGKGVKLPLSKHKKSARYACLATTIDELQRAFVSRHENLDEEFAIQQRDILQAFQLPQWEHIRTAFDIDSNGEAPTESDFLRLETLATEARTLTLDEVLVKLSDCAVLNQIVNRFREGTKLSEQERAIMVGLLNRLQSPSRPRLGRDLLMEFFRQQPGFKPVLTEAKLQNLNLYPPTCAYLQKRLGREACPCMARRDYTVAKSPIELVEGTQAISEDIFAISPADVDFLRRAEIKYTEKNDEISLHFIIRRLQELDDTETAEQCKYHLKVQRSLSDYYCFSRPESAEKTRHLISLSAEDKILSTWFAKILDGLFGAEVSDNSYGYRFEPSLSKCNIFKPWLAQWRRYTKALAKIIEDDAYGGYWVVALDIHSFYDEILLERLARKLGQGPSRGCSAILESLDTDSRAIYSKLCDTLVAWCRELGNGTRGVPQGPAFARYLAELYLMQFDQDVEDGAGRDEAYYFRYVDDIFLIVRGENEGRLWNARLREMIGELSLEVNENKAFLGTVRQYRNKFQEYQDESKYFVDRISWNTRSASASLSNRAVDELTTMALLPDGGGIQPDNAAFFLTHLHDQHPIQAVRQEVIPLLLQLQYGRGSLFKHILRPAITQWRNYDFVSGFLPLDQFRGLKLEVLLNLLLHNIVTDPITELQAANLSDVMVTIAQGELTDLSRLLQVQITLADRRLYNAQLLQTITTETLVKAFRYGVHGPLPDEVCQRVMGDLMHRPVVDVIQGLYTLVFRNELSVELYSRAAAMFFSAVMEGICGDGETRGLPCLNPSADRSLQLLQKYHLLCCFCSIIGHDKNPSELEGVWRALINATNTCENWHATRPLWLAKAGCVELDHRSITALLAALVGGDGLLPGRRDRWNVFRAYHGQLVLFLFAGDGLCPLQGQVRASEIRDAALRTGAVFLEWIMDDHTQTRLYPFKKLCLNNIIENDIMVLQRGQRLLIRQPVDRELIAVPSSLAVETSTVEASGAYRNTVYSYRPEIFQDLSAILRRQTDLMSIVDATLTVYSGLCDFCVNNVPPECRGIPNVFADGLKLHSDSCHPLVAESVFASKLLVSEDGASIRSYDNNRDTGWYLLVERIKVSQLSLLPYSHIGQVQAEHFSEYTLPADATDTESQVKFLRLLVDSVGPIAALTPHSLDRRKFWAVAQFAEWFLQQEGRATENRRPILLGIALRNYLSLSSSRGFARRLIFQPINECADTNLHTLFTTLQRSLQDTATQRDFDWGNLEPTALIVEQFAIITAVVRVFKNPSSTFETQLLAAQQQPSEGDATDMVDLHDVARASVQTGEENELFVNQLHLLPSEGTTREGHPVYVCRFGAYEPKIEKLRLTDAMDLKRNTPYLYASEDKVLIVLPDDILRGCYETVKKRSEWWERRAHPDTDQSVVEGLRDRLHDLSRLRGDPKFTEAVEVIRSNHQTSDLLRTREDCERYLLRWLGQFDDGEAETILHVIAAHRCITPEDVNAFISQVNAWRARGIVFATKRTADMGGVQRLFTLTPLGQDIFRSLSLDESVGKICTEGGTGGADTLLILTENILSGTQLIRALKEHYLADTPARPDFIEWDHLYQLPVEPGVFLTAASRFRRVIVLTAAYTQDGWGRVRDVLCERLHLGPEAVTVEGVQMLSEECFFEQTPRIPVNTKNAFESLVRNIDRVGALFDLSHVEREAYLSSLRSLQKTNLVVRPNSVPKKDFLLFTLKPRNSCLQPLFRRIPEH